VGGLAVAADRRGQSGPENVARRLRSRNEKSPWRTGLKYPPRGVEQIADSSGNQGGAAQSGAKSGALSGDSAHSDPDLAAVVAAWPVLPDEKRKAIVRLATGGP
jgi:hypothetical protein